LDDGPAIQYDWAGSALWATALDLNTQNMRLHIFNNCGAAIPGQPGCPLTSPLAMTVGTTNGKSHPNVLVNPSTHHGIVSFIDSSDRVNVKFYTVNGVLSSSFVLAGFDGAFFARNTGCPAPNPQTQNQAIAKCTGPGNPTDCTSMGGSTCSRLVPRVQMAEKFDGAALKQYLYLAYDINCGIIGFDNFKTRVRVYDTTNETAPVFVRDVWSTGASLPTACASATQEFMGTVESARGSPNVGFYFYRQGLTNGNYDPCKTDFRGKISTSNTFASTAEVVFSQSTFPTVVFSWTMGDYVGTTDGLAFGNLYPTWAEPRVSVGTPMSGCVKCGTLNYALVVRGNTAVP